MEIPEKKILLVGNLLEPASSSSFSSRHFFAYERARARVCKTRRQRRARVVPRSVPEPSLLISRRHTIDRSIDREINVHGGRGEQRYDSKSFDFTVFFFFSRIADDETSFRFDRASVEYFEFLGRLPGTDWRDSTTRTVSRSTDT